MPKDLAEFDEGDAIARVREVIEDPTVLMKRLAAIMVGRVLDTFDKQGRGPVRWAPRGVPSVMNIVEAVNLGKGIKDRWLRPRKALINTGTLRNSIAKPKVSHAVAEIGSTVPYASKAQAGGAAETTLTPSGHKALQQFLKTSGQRVVGGRSLNRALGWLKPGSTVKTVVPARPFAFLTKEDEQDLNAEATDFMVKAITGS